MDETKTIKSEENRKSPARARKTPLFKKLELKYEEQEEMETLAMKKKRLEEIRTLVKPIDPKEISKHDQYHKKLRQEKLNEIAQKR
jgi:hypothetical protein